MSDTAPATQPAEATAPEANDETKPPAEAKPDRRSEIGRLLKEEGVKLKAKDREISVSSLEDLTSRAQRVFGMESMLEEAKRDKAEAEKTKAWRQRLKSRDTSAFDEMDSDEQVALAEWYEKKAAEYEKARELPPEVREAQQREESYRRKLADYEKAEAQRKQAADEEEYAKGVESTKAELMGVAMGALKSLKAEGADAGLALPRIARVLRNAEAEGVQLSGDEVAALVAEDMRSEYGRVVGGLTDDGALFDFLGPDVAKRVMREALRRRGQVAPSVQRAASQPKPRQDEDSKLRGKPGYFR